MDVLPCKCPYRLQHVSSILTRLNPGAVPRALAGRSLSALFPPDSGRLDCYFDGVITQRRLSSISVTTSSHCQLHCRRTLCILALCPVMPVTNVDMDMSASVSLNVHSFAYVNHLLGPSAMEDRPLVALLPSSTRCSPKYLTARHATLGSRLPYAIRTLIRDLSGTSQGPFTANIAPSDRRVADVCADL